MCSFRLFHRCMVARLRCGAKARISRRFVRIRTIRQFVQPLQGRGQRAVAHRGRIGKAAAHHAHSAPSRPRCRAGRSVSFPPQRPSRAAGPRCPAPLRHGFRRPDQIAGLGAGKTQLVQLGDAEVGDPRRRGMGPHGADFVPRQLDDFAAQGGSKFDVDLLADNAPAQASKPVGRQGSRRPRRRAARAAWRVSNCVT